MKESAYNDTLQSLQRQFNEYREAFARVRMNMIDVWRDFFFEF